MKPDTDVVIFYGMVPKEKWSSVTMPDGTFSKAFVMGRADQICDMKECKHWGMAFSTSLHILAKKLFPEIMNSPIIRIGKGARGMDVR